MSAPQQYFRSHLMQQFHQAASRQSRPPMIFHRKASTPTTTSSHRKGYGGSSNNSQSLLQQDRLVPSYGASTPFPAPASSVMVAARATTTSTSDFANIPEQEDPDEFSEDEILTDEEVETQEKFDDDSVSSDSDDEHLSRSSSASFLSFGQPRRTFATEQNNKDEIFRKALNRAIQFAQQANNQKWAERFYFRRIVGHSSPKREEFLDIVYEVTKNLVSKKKSRPDAETFARRKRQRWSGIPVFLVALAENNQTASVLPKQSGTLFEPLPFQPLLGEEQMESYAATNAAIQNILLSLQNEGFATKWVTGPIIRTPAFRCLLGAANTDRVVGLVMVCASGFRRQPSSLQRGIAWNELVSDL